MTQIAKYICFDCGKDADEPNGFCAKCAPEYPPKLPKPANSNQGRADETDPNGDAA
jgi:predicted amidophosphoribosyltransferase